MSTPHTSGPWTIERFHLGQWIKAGESFVCPLHDHIEHEGEPCGCIASQDKTQAEIDANARLIAAAPETLAEFESLLDHFLIVQLGNLNQHGTNCHAVAPSVFDRARAAIAKAKGETP